MTNPNQYARMSQDDPYKEIEALTAKVKELEDLIVTRECLFSALTAEQDKVKVLVDALELAAEQIRKCDYTPARSTLLVTLAAVKGE